MKVSVIGSGYVGMVTGLCLAEWGNDVTCVDVIEDKVDSMNRGDSPIFEDGMDELLGRNLAAGRFRATTDMTSVRDTEVSFICVGTPSREDGSWNLDFVRSAVMAIGEQLPHMDDRHVVVLKSTVLPGTCVDVVIPALESSSGMHAIEDFGVAVNPEFLREGVAIEDFMNPDRVVIGHSDEASFRTVSSLYADTGSPILGMTLTTAEMVKVASNSFLATKISFVNEMGNVCKALGIDFHRVADGMGLDHRIGPHFLVPGIGFGGSCFPKDVSGIATAAKELDVSVPLLDSVLLVNEMQPIRFVDMVSRRVVLDGAKVAVLGLAFKPGTDDIRESRSIPVVEELLRRGATVKAHDPEAMGRFEALGLDVVLCDSVHRCLEGVDAALILTAWEEYSDADLYIGIPVFDGRGVVRTDDYEGMCW